MKARVMFLVGCLLIGWMASPLPAAPPKASQFRAGAATSNITPLLGGGIIGGFVPFPATHVHDELHAKCLVLDDGQTKLALVVLDLLGIHPSVSTEARKRIQQSVGIPPDRVLITAIHTHSATSALGPNPYYEKDREMEIYQNFLVHRIADGVQCALNNLRPAQMTYVTAEAPEHVFNRRWFMKPGKMSVNPFGTIDKARMNPPAGSPDLDGPAGPTDPTVSVLAFREPDGKPIAVFASYSLHYVGGVGSGHISADYFAMFGTEVARLLNAERQDPPFVAMMANGTSGDVNNINFLNPRPYKGPYVQMRAVADDVAKKVCDALAGAKYQDRVTLAARYRELPVATRHPTPEETSWAQKTLAAPVDKANKNNVDLSRIYAERAMNLAKKPAISRIPLQVLRIGDVCVGTMPCEVFCEIGLEFKKRSPIQPAFLISLAHGYFGYLPTPAQHELGGYETWIGTNSLERQASVKMLDALVEMAAEIKAESKPSTGSPLR
jgi:neutral ceramidase